jgi:hypothetical protein
MGCFWFAGGYLGAVWQVMTWAVWLESGLEVCNGLQTL